MQYYWGTGKNNKHTGASEQDRDGIGTQSVQGCPTFKSQPWLLNILSKAMDQNYIPSYKNFWDFKSLIRVCLNKLKLMLYY